MGIHRSLAQPSPTGQRKGRPRNWWGSRSSAGDKKDRQWTTVWYPLRTGTQTEQHVLQLVVKWRKDWTKASLEAERPVRRLSSSPGCELMVVCTEAVAMGRGELWRDCDIFNK